MTITNSELALIHRSAKRCRARIRQYRPSLVHVDFPNARAKKFGMTHVCLQLNKDGATFYGRPIIENDDEVFDTGLLRGEELRTQVRKQARNAGLDTLHADRMVKFLDSLVA